MSSRFIYIAAYCSLRLNNILLYVYILLIYLSINACLLFSKFFLALNSYVLLKFLNLLGRINVV